MSKKAIVDFIPAQGGNSVAYTNFIARTSGLDTTHLNAYAGLLNGLTTDGLFNSDGTSSYLDVLYCWATQDATTSLLNLVSSSFGATNTGSCTFTADKGYSSFSGTKYILSYNASTAGGHYSQNSADMGVWCYDAASANFPAINLVGGSLGQNIYPMYNGTSTYMRVNDNPEAGAFTTAGTAGFYLGNRSSSTARQGYYNGGSIGTYGSQASQALVNAAFAFPGGSTWIKTLSGGCFGGSLNSTLQGNLYTRLRTYMTAVGVP